MTNAESPQQTATLTIDQALQQAIAHHQAGQLQDAERLYRTILQTQPNHPDANHNLGVLVVQVKQPAAGLPHLKVALEANPNQGQYWLSYIDALIQTSQTDAARQVLEQGRQRGLQGEAVEALAGRLDRLENATPDRPAEQEPAIAHREAGRYKEAALVLQSGLVSNPQDANAYALLAQVLSLDKQDEPAWVALNMAFSINPALPIVQRNHARLLLKQQKPDEALQAAQGAYQSDATDPENQLVLAAALVANHQNEQAFPLVANTLQSCPNYAEAYAIRAQLKLRGNDLAGALADAEKTLSIKPHLGQLWGIVGSLRHQLKNLPGTIDALEKALDYEPDNVGHLVRLGEFKRQAGAVEAAIALLEKAIAIAPDNAGAWVNLGTALQESQRIPEAKAAYAKALEIAPEQAEVASNLGALAKQEGNWEEALRYFNQALVYQPTRVAIITNRAGALNALERYDEAEASYRRALEIKPAFAEAHCNLANVLRDFGQLDDAIASYRRALEIKPDCADVHFNLGHALRDLDDYRQAAVSYQKASDIDPAKTGLEAAVYSAILCYLVGNFDQCRSKLDVSQQILATSGFKRRNARVYWRYLDKLLSWHQQSKLNDRQRQDLETLYVIGESHSLVTNGVVIRYEGREMRCAAEWIAGCKQWHLGNGKANIYKYKFEAVMARLPRHSTILLTIGEIDCRLDEGIIKAWKKLPDKSLEEVEHLTANNYLKYVEKIAARHEHQLIIGGVPATNIKMDKMTEEERKQFVQLIRSFNILLMEQSLFAGMAFLDVYALTDRGDGIASGQWHVDDYHLLPSAMSEAFAKHCIQ